MGIKLTFPKLAVLTLVVAAILFVAETMLQAGSGGSLLLSMVFWLSLAEGCVALMAAAEIAHGSWHRPILHQMLSAQAMIPVIGVILVVFYTQLDIYPWVDSPGFWLNKNFFIARHVAMPLIVFALARKFSIDTFRGVDSKRRWAVIYALVFVAHQTMVGLELVMTLEKPWFSTLFGAWFMVSSFLSGISVGAFLLFSARDRFDDTLAYAQKSIGGLMFGFATFWAYFYFSQLIVIWYGNLPEEVSYLARRIGYHTPYWAVARLIFGLVWVVPFAVLMGRKPKRTPAITLAMAWSILIGLFLQYWLTIQPVAAVNPALGGIDTILLGFVFLSVMRSGDAMLPSGGLGTVAPSSAAPVH